MGLMGLEADIEKEFVAYCESKGCLCLKLILANGRGFPDRTVITPNGQVIFFELKRPGGKLSAAQKKWISKLKENGKHVYVVDTIAEATKRLDEHLKTNCACGVDVQQSR